MYKFFQDIHYASQSRTIAIIFALHYNFPITKTQTTPYLPKRKTPLNSGNKVSIDRRVPFKIGILPSRRTARFSTFVARSTTVVFACAFGPHKSNETIPSIIPFIRRRMKRVCFAISVVTCVCVLLDPVFNFRMCVDADPICSRLFVCVLSRYSINYSLVRVLN